MHRHKPLDLVEKESISVVNPNPEPLPKPPPPLLDILISLKVLSILPEPIDCKDIKPPFSPLFFSICGVCQMNFRWVSLQKHKKMMKGEKLIQRPLQEDPKIPCFCLSH